MKKKEIGCSMVKKTNWILKVVMKFIDLSSKIKRKVQMRSFYITDGLTKQLWREA